MKINLPPVQVPVSGNEDAVKKADRLQKEKDLETACQGFEALMLNKMMKGMRDTLPGNTLFPESNSSNILQSLHDQYLTDKLSTGKQALGFKEFLFEELKDSV